MKNKQSLILRNKLKKTYELSYELFPGISEFCKKCNTCCKTYGWLLRKEAEEFVKKGCPVAKINNFLYCIDSFAQDKSGKRVLDRIPRCRFYKNRRCLIYKERPLDCRLYPVKVRFGKEGSFIGLSLGCKYISCLPEFRKNRVCENIISFFKKAPKSIIGKYLDLIYQVNLVSKPKKFWLKKLIEIKKENGSWETKALEA